MNAADVQEHLTQLSGWKKVEDSIQKEFNFANFMESMAFVNNIVPLAEEMGHHPDIKIEYSKVTLILTTHEEDGVSQKDFDLALKVEDLVNKKEPPTV